MMINGWPFVLLRYVSNKKVRILENLHDLLLWQNSRLKRKRKIFYV